MGRGFDNSRNQGQVITLYSWEKHFIGKAAQSRLHRGLLLALALQFSLSHVWPILKTLAGNFSDSVVLYPIVNSAWRFFQPPHLGFLPLCTFTTRRRNCFFMLMFHLSLPRARLSWWNARRHVKCARWFACDHQHAARALRQALLERRENFNLKRTFRRKGWLFFVVLDHVCPKAVVRYNV